MTWLNDNKLTKEEIQHGQKRINEELDDAQEVGEELLDRIKDIIHNLGPGSLKRSEIEAHIDKGQFKCDCKIVILKNSYVAVVHRNSKDEYIVKIAKDKSGELSVEYIRSQNSYVDFGRTDEIGVYDVPFNYEGSKICRVNHSFNNHFGLAEDRHFLSDDPQSISSAMVKITHKEENITGIHYHIVRDLTEAEHEQFKKVHKYKYDGEWVEAPEEHIDYYKQVYKELYEEKRAKEVQDKPSGKSVQATICRPIPALNVRLDQHNKAVRRR